MRPRWLWLLALWPLMAASDEDEATVRLARPKRLLEIRLLKPATIERMREAIVEVVPEALATDPPRRKASQRK